VPSDPVSATPWQRLPAELAVAMRPGLSAAVESVSGAVARATPTYAQIEDPKFTQDVRAAVQVALDRFLDLVGTDQPALPPKVREVFVGLGAAEARESRGPQGLLAGLRVASRLMLRTAGEALGRVRPLSTAEMIDLGEAVTAYVDELAAASTDGFTRQLREQAGESDRRRRLGEVLLRGGAAAGVVTAAAAGIGWRGLDLVVPVLLPPEAARDVRFRYGADGVVVERERDAVLLLRPGPRATRAQLADTLAGRRAVVGPTLGWAQVPEGVRLAELAGELVGLGRTVGGSPGAGPGREPVFADDQLAALALRGEPGALAVLSARRLAPFASVRPTSRDRLLQTLHSWLRHWGSRAEVAAELFVHPQTVSYRLRLLRELIGDDLDDADARFELLLVLASRAQAGRATGTGP
jgi:hypothetical protein